MNPNKFNSVYHDNDTMSRQIYLMYTMVSVWRKKAYPDTLSSDELSAKIVRQIECLKEELKETLMAYEELASSDEKDIKPLMDGIIDTIWVAMMLLSFHETSVNKKMKDINGERYQVKFDYQSGNSFFQKALWFTLCDESSVDATMSLIYAGFDYLSLLRPHTSCFELFQEVVVSNYSKIVDDELPLDDTGKITKQVAKDRGSYIEPDFSVYMVEQINPLLKDIKVTVE